MLFRAGLNQEQGLTSLSGELRLLFCPLDNLKNSGFPDFQISAKDVPASNDPSLLVCFPTGEKLPKGTRARRFFRTCE